MNWIYIQSEANLFTVGFYDPDGKFKPESDHSNREEAAKRVSWLNGGQNREEIRQAIREELVIDGIQYSFAAQTPGYPVADETMGYPAYQVPLPNIKLAAGAPIPQCAHIWVANANGDRFKCIKCRQLRIQ